ncbi:NAD(P)H-dependent oxidoreductase [Algoriphagus sp. AK58]|uniref:NAD(P)H-dependent oxidoreductase n=1 Tax=Algoriphagus sp. AK58 TaxID=1406877 RepID=UPI00164FBE5E|nr:NAD(P)H-dependent oxidoreductase [Algoriphagus sp. AK58]MBC6366822.1 NAD(P)H-dependent oxidoreductase [Algoriphagus sp. AK58]
MKLLENLNWRYATKSFNPDKKVSAEHIKSLKEAVRLSASSYGLQLYRVLVIENPDVRSELRKVSYDQKQITEASHLFVFCTLTERFEEGIDEYFHLLFQTPGANKNELNSYWNTTKLMVSGMEETNRKSWMEKQCYLAMSTLLMACAELKIDACPMEGFEKERYDSILGLREKGLNASVIVPVGYRSDFDQTQYRVKVRKDQETLFISLP